MSDHVVDPDRNDDPRTIAQEARTFGVIMQAALMRLGEFYAPSTVKPHGKQMGGRQLQKVQFERVYYNPEIIYYKVKVHKKTLFGSKSALPHRVRLMDLMCDETAKELSHACMRKVSWQCDDDMPERGAWFLVHRTQGVGGIPRHVPFAAMLEHYPQDMSSIPFVLGSGRHRTVEMITLGKTPHLLIAGPTGTGKSNAANGFILAQMHLNAPTDLQFILIDLKEGIEFKDYEESPHLYQPVVRDVLKGLDVLGNLVEEIKRRMKLLGARFKDWGTYRGAHPEAGPFLICVIDEYAQFVFAHGPRVKARANARLIKIAAQGRAVGIQLIVCTQYPTGEVVDRQVRVNLNAAIAFRCMTSTQSTVILNVGDAADLPDVKGRALFTCGPDVKEVQMAYVSPDDTESILLECKEKYGIKVFEEEPEAVEPDPEPDVPEEKEEFIEGDPGKWYQERAERDRIARTAIGVLYDDYEEWAQRNDCIPISKNAIATWLDDHGFPAKMSNGVRYRRFIRLKPVLSSASIENESATTMPIEEVAAR